MLRRLLGFALCCLIPTLLPAAAPEPPYPDTYNVVLRYRIRTVRTQRILQYREMLQALKDAGFVRDEDDRIEHDEAENPAYTRMKGTIPAKGIPRVLAQRYVQAVLLYPRGTKLPEKGTRARVDLQLPSNYLPETQRKLARDTADVLAKDAGFVEAVGYDGRGDTRLVGSVPAENLDLLLEDVRRLPSGKEKGRPFANASPVRFILVRPDWPVPAGMPKVPEVPAKERKFSPELRRLLADAGKAGKSTRMEVILGWTPAEKDRGWQQTIEVEGVVAEDRVGPLVTVVGVPKDAAPRLAALPDVVAVRLPYPGQQRRFDAADDAAPVLWEPLRASGLTALHDRGKRGEGSRIALVADDFTGWEKLKGRKLGKTRLPDPVLVDLTAERNADLKPDPFPARGKGEGFGTRCARSILEAAPRCELTLVRIDETAPAMLQTVAAAINGSRPHTVSLARRLAEIREQGEVLERRTADLLEERRRVLNNPREDAEWLKEKEAYDRRQKEHDANVDEYGKLRTRYFKLLRDLDALRGIRLVASTLVWTEGYPAGGGSALSRHFNDRPFRAALWFQAAGDTAGQGWSGLFRDEDGDGVMEFAPAKDRLPAGAWSHEVNFLGWHPASGKAGREVPANARLRLSLQWREAHDPLPLKAGEDPYREPLTKLRLLVVFQPDPDGKNRPGDDLEVVAVSADPPVRLDQTFSAATYEHTLEVPVTRAGRYGVVVEGRIPESISPPGENRLPEGGKKMGEIRPRLLVHTLEGPGRAVWSSYATPGAEIGTPADSRSVIAVGAADAMDRRRASSAAGSPAGMELTSKPDTLAYDMGGGTGQAASFAAGLVGAAWPNTGSLFGMVERMRDRPGTLLRVPKR